jgi:hypothetical protein
VLGACFALSLSDSDWGIMDQLAIHPIPAAIWDLNKPAIACSSTRFEGHNYLTAMIFVLNPHKKCQGIAKDARGLFPQKSTRALAPRGLLQKPSYVFCA